MRYTLVSVPATGALLFFRRFAGSFMLQRPLAKLLELLFEFERDFPCAGAGGFVRFLDLAGHVFLKLVDVFVDLFYKCVHVGFLH